MCVHNLKKRVLFGQRKDTMTEGSVTKEALEKEYDIHI